MIGGVSYIGEIYSKGKNKYIEFYKDIQPSEHIMYLDANKLYGCAMDQDLPNSEFKWLNYKEIDKFDASAVNENNSHGYILEFDLEYPDVLSELYNDYLLAPEKLGVSHDMLSKYCNSIVNKYDIKSWWC